MPLLSTLLILPYLRRVKKIFDWNIPFLSPAGTDKMFSREHYLKCCSILWTGEDVDLEASVEYSK